MLLKILYNIFEDESFGKKGVLMNRNKEVVLKKKKKEGLEILVIELYESIFICNEIIKSF